MATRHLLDLGHRRIGHITGPEDWPQAGRPAAGFHDAMGHADIEPPVRVAGDWQPAAGYEAAGSSTRTPSTTAIFVANDQMALGVMRALVEPGGGSPGTSAWSASTTSPRRASSATPDDDPQDFAAGPEAVRPSSAPPAARAAVDPGPAPAGGPRPTARPAARRR